MRDIPELPSRAALGGIVVLFALVGLLVYGASLRNGFVQLDDGLLVYQNPAVVETSWASIKRAFTTYDPELYVPLTLLSYQLDYQLGDGVPFWFHAHNLTLHILNALLVCWLAYILLKHRTAAFLVGLIFLVHPLHTEAVAWVSARKDVLSTFHFLAAIITFTYARHRESRRLLLLSLIFFLCGLLGKVMILTLPIVLILLLLREKGTITKRDIPVLLPYFGLSIIFGIVALFGKTEVVASSTLLQKILMAAKSAVFYLGKLFWPFDLSVLYPYSDVITITSPDFSISILVVLALAGFSVWMLRTTREYFIWFLFYLVTLAPTFINIAKGEFADIYMASDRYAYIPSIGIFLILGFLVTRFLPDDLSVRTRTARMQSVAAIASILFGSFAFLTYKQAAVWHDGVALFEHALAHAPEANAIAYNNLGNAYRSMNDDEKAVEQYEKSLELRTHARTYGNLGATYRRMKRYADAERAYSQALELDASDARAHAGLALVYAEQRKTQEAFAAYERSIALEPIPEVLVNMGTLYEQTGQSERAIETYQKAIDLQPLSADAHYNKAVVLTKLGRIDDAILAYEEAVALQPRRIPARINLGILYSQRGDLESSRDQFQAILRIDPQNKAARSALEQLDVLSQ